MKKLNLLLIGLAINLLLVVSCDKKMPTGVEPTKKLSKTSPAVVGKASTLSENIPLAISPMTVPPAVTADPFASDFLAPLVAQSIVAQSIVVPNSLEFIEGNTNNAAPFNIALFGLPSMRYQQVFDASQFGALSGFEICKSIADNLVHFDFAIGVALGFFNRQIAFRKIDLLPFQVQQFTNPHSRINS